jgi:SSS family solute:Na+ symporter
MKSYTTTERRIKLTVIAYPVFAIFLVPVLFIGFSAIGVVPPDALESSDQVLPHLITYEIGATGLVYGLIGAGALAAAMSSSDAITHGASVSVGRDIVRPLKPDMPERTQLLIMRVSVVLVGAVAYYLAIFGGEGLIQLLLGAYGYIVQFAPPVYGALYWRRATRQGALAGLVGGVAVNGYYQLIADGTPLDINAGMVALTVNIVLFVGVSLLVRQSDEIRARGAAFVET